MWGKNKASWYWISLFGVGLVLAANILPKYFREHVKSQSLLIEPIDKFEIGKLSFEKKDQAWFFTDDSKKRQPANLDSVNQFLETSKKIKLDRIVSIEPSSFEALGIKHENQLNLGGNTYWLGKLGPNYDTTFIQLATTNNVFEIPSIWGNLEIFKSDYWVNKYATNFPIFQISKVEIQGKKFLPKDGKWENQKWIETLAYLKNGTYLGIEKPKSKFEYEFKLFIDHEENKIFIGDYWVKYGDFYYEIAKSDFDVLTSVLK